MDAADKLLMQCQNSLSVLYFSFSVVTLNGPFKKKGRKICNRFVQCLLENLHTHQKNKLPYSRIQHIPVVAENPA